MELDYLIAGHRIRIEGKALTEAVEALPGFDVFKVETMGEPLCRFVESATKAPPFKKILYTSEIDGYVSRFGRYSRGYLFSKVSYRGESLTVRTEEDGRIAYFNGNFEMNLLRLACWIAFGVATIPFQTVAIHTSVIQHGSMAALFLGESGTGKSTHTRLWRENIEGAVLLNDDSPIVRIIDGKPWVYGSPWSGKTHCYKNECYPLAACVRLSQAPFNKIKKLNVVEAYGALHPSCPPFFAYDDVLYDSISSVLSKVLANIPVYHLSCLPNADAARLSFHTIFGLCEK